MLHIAYGNTQLRLKHHVSIRWHADYAECRFKSTSSHNSKHWCTGGGEADMCGIPVGPMSGKHTSWQRKRKRIWLLTNSWLFETRLLWWSQLHAYFSHWRGFTEEQTGALSLKHSCLTKAAKSPNKMHSRLIQMNKRLNCATESIYVKFRAAR